MRHNQVVYPVTVEFELEPKAFLLLGKFVMEGYSDGEGRLGYGFNETCNNPTFETWIWVILSIFGKWLVVHQDLHYQPRDCFDDCHDETTMGRLPQLLEV